MKPDFNENPGANSVIVKPAAAPTEGDRRRLRYCLLFVLLISGCFAGPLWELVRYSLREELHSHIVLIPFITAWLLHLKIGKLSCGYVTSWKSAIVFMIAGTVALFGMRHFPDLSRNDSLSIMAAAFISFIMMGLGLFFGYAWLRAAAFPLCFLVFMIPLPDLLVQKMEAASQHASADAAAGFFRLAGTPYLREGDIFSLPGIDPIEVAPECSGIRSSWVLFITCLLAGHLFLAKGWSRLLLAVFVIPLGLVRNGFRVATISWLCMNHGMEMIDSWIHHHGGPIFFAISLVPLGIAIILLRRREIAVSQKNAFGTM